MVEYIVPYACHLVAHHPDFVDAPLYELRQMGGEKWAQTELTLITVGAQQW